MPAWQKTNVLGAGPSAAYAAAMERIAQIDGQIAQINNTLTFESTPKATPSPTQTPTSTSYPTSIPISTPTEKSTPKPTSRVMLDPNTRYIMSDRAKDILKFREGDPAYLKRTGIGVFNEKGELIGIYPHYVNDGGITLGYGHHISQKYMDEDAANLLYQYVPKETPMNGPRGTIVPGSKYISIAEVERIFEADVRRHENSMNETLKNNGIPVAANEFDALVFVRFNEGNVSSVYKLLEQGNRDRESWREKWPESDGRMDAGYRMFFDEDYSLVR